MLSYDIVIRSQWHTKKNFSSTRRYLIYFAESDLDVGWFGVRPWTVFIMMSWCSRGRSSLSDKPFIEFSCWSCNLKWIFRQHPEIFHSSASWLRWGSSRNALKRVASRSWSNGRRASVRRVGVVSGQRRSAAALRSYIGTGRMITWRWGNITRRKVGQRDACIPDWCCSVRVAHLAPFLTFRV